MTEAMYTWDADETGGPGERGEPAERRAPGEQGGSTEPGAPAGRSAPAGRGTPADRGGADGPESRAPGPGAPTTPATSTTPATPITTPTRTTPTRRLPHVDGFARLPSPGDPGLTRPKQEGKALRAHTPRSAHAWYAPDDHRPDPVQVIEDTNRDRITELAPLRVGRMAASPFAFLRGTAGLMAYDLARTPLTGIGAQICGDAHAANFGLYGDVRGGLVIDLNDFDETVHGPWEWDVKRLVTSLVLAGREAGAKEDVCEEAAYDAVGAYRRTMRLLAKLPVLEAWNAIADEELVSHTDARDLLGTLERVSAKARQNTSARFAAKSTEPVPGAEVPAGHVTPRRFVDAPPVLRRVPDEEAAAVTTALGAYLTTLPEDRLPLLARYAIQDVAFRVVGTGSVGLRSYVVLLLDHRGEPLVLQVKEARPSVLLPHLPAAGFKEQESDHEGHRVVLGQKRMQVVSDSLLGWTTIAGRPFQVRQFRNRKGSVDPAALAADQLDDYGRMTGALLARAHAHSADPRLIAGYCGKNDELDEAMAAFAVAYADRTESDHALLVAAVRAGRLRAVA